MELITNSQVFKITEGLNQTTSWQLVKTQYPNICISKKSFGSKLRKLRWKFRKVLTRNTQATKAYSSAPFFSDEDFKDIGSLESRSERNENILADEESVPSSEEISVFAPQGEHDEPVPNVVPSTAFKIQEINVTSFNNLGENTGFSALTTDMERVLPTFSDTVAGQNLSNPGIVSTADLDIQEVNVCPPDFCGDEKKNNLNTKIKRLRKSKKMLKMKNLMRLAKVKADFKRAMKIASERQKLIEKKDGRILDLSTQLEEEKNKNRVLQLQLARRKYKTKQFMERKVEEDRNKKDVMEQMRKKFQEKSKEISILENMNESLKNNEINLFENGMYSDELRVCAWDLLQLGIPARQIPQAMKTVLQRLAGTDLKRCPSRSFVSRLVTESHCLLMKQLSEKLESEKDITLSIDSATHKSISFLGSQVHFADGSTYTLGLRAICQEDAKSLLGYVHEKFSEIAREGLKPDEDELGKLAELITKITNVMSDQAPVNGAFANQLEDFKKTFLPMVLANNDFTPAQLNNLEKVNIFYCKMHLLSNMSTSTINALKQLESLSVPQERNPHAYTGESPAVQRLNRNISLVLHPHQNEQTWRLVELWKAFLQIKAIVDPNVVHYEHNRAAIEFPASTRILILLAYLKEFFEYEDSSQIYLSIKHDLNDQVALNQVGAMSLYNVLVIAPFWRILYGKDRYDEYGKTKVHILELIPHLQSLQNFLLDVSHDGSQMLDGKSPFPEAFLEKDKVNKVMEAIAANNLNRTQIIEVVQVIAEAMLLTLTTQAADFLNGGRLDELQDDPNFVMATLSVPTTNQRGESLFGLARFIKDSKPNAKSTTLQAHCMLRTNRPVDYIDSKNNSERQEIIESARKSYQKRKSEEIIIDRNYKADLLKKRQKNIDSKKVSEDIKGRKKLEIVRKFTETYGPPWLQHEVQSKLDLIDNDKEKLPALNLLIEFLHKIGDATCSNKNVFNKTLNKKEYSLAEKLVHLDKIYQENPHLKQLDFCEEIPPAVIDVTDAAEVVVTALQQKRLNAVQKQSVKRTQKLYGMFLQEPEKLINCKFEIKVNGEWLQGIVHDIVKPIKKSICFKTEINGDIMHKMLLLELKKGNLIVLNKF